MIPSTILRELLIVTFLAGALRAPLATPLAREADARPPPAQPRGRAEALASPGEGEAPQQAPAPGPVQAPAPGQSREQEKDKEQEKGGGARGSIEEEIERARRRFQAQLGQGAFSPEDLQLEHLNAEDERVVGEASVRAILGRFRRAPIDAPASLYVRKVGALVATASSRRDLPHHFVLLEAEEAQAFSSPGGYVFITVGALKIIRSEAELAFLLAHEVAHIERRHGLLTLVRGQLDIQKRDARARLDALTGRGPSAVEAGLRKRMDELSNQIVQARGLPDEEEADALGLAHLAAVGYDPHATVDVLERLCHEEEASAAAGRPVPPLLRTHPGSKERLESLRPTLEKLPPGGVVAAERYRESVLAPSGPPGAKEAVGK